MLPTRSLIARAAASLVERAHRRRQVVVAAIVCGATAMAMRPCAATAGPAIELVALTPSNVLLRFDAGRPAEATRVAVTGVGGTLVGIDLRPSKQVVYGVSTTNDVYTIDVASGAAASVSTLTVAFDGGPRSGCDFNPQADRLRLAGGNGQNLRVNVDLGAAAVDGPLAYARTDKNAGTKPQIAAAAYTNSVAGAPATKLFDIDAGLDVLALQDPPNDGVLTTVGPLGVDFRPESGFEIVTRDGADLAFAVTGGTLYTVDLVSGAATKVGPVGDGSAELIGLTAVPPPH